MQVKDSVSIPVVANGDIRTEADITKVHQSTGVDGTYIQYSITSL